MRAQPPAQGLLGLYRPDIAEALTALQVPTYRRGQVCEHLLRRPLQPFAQSTTLPADVRRRLDALGASTLAPAGSRTASDGTIKLLLQARDDALIESVMMPYQKRVTVCISSQVGCPVGCAFCATGGMGFRRNLSVAEIVDQVRAVSALALGEGRRISNLVFMGMGEPLLNLQAVLDSIRVFTDPGGLNLAHRAVSVSTVGIPAGIDRLARSEPQVNLALSLHAADDRTRERLIPKRHLHPLSEVLAAAWRHFALTHRKLLVEYVLLHEVNDSPEDARRLTRLLRGHVVTVNLLAWNPVFGPGWRHPDAEDAGPRSPGRVTGTSTGKLVPAAAGRTAGSPTVIPAGSASGNAAGGERPPKARWTGFHPSRAAAVALFRDTLLDAGIEAVVRRSKGADIQAACGQLAGRRQEREDDGPAGSTDTRDPVD